MNKKETIYAVLLCFSLFSISFIFFSNTITHINVSVQTGEPIYVKIPYMFSIIQVIFLMIFTGVAVFSFTYLYKDLSKLEERSKKQELATKVLEGDEKKLYKLILNKKEILQKELVLESGYPKSKVTRILEKLDSKQLITRSPFGNTNKISLKE